MNLVFLLYLGKPAKLNSFPLSLHPQMHQEETVSVTDNSVQLK